MLHRVGIAFLVAAGLLDASVVAVAAYRQAGPVYDFVCVRIGDGMCQKQPAPEQPVRPAPFVLTPTGRSAGAGLG